MKKDAEVRLMMQERSKGRSQAVAAARAGMSERTARTYERRGVLPSQQRRPRTHRTRVNPFAEDWEWVVSQLERDPALQATTLFALLCARPGDTRRRRCGRCSGISPTGEPFRGRSVRCTSLRNHGRGTWRRATSPI